MDEPRYWVCDSLPEADGPYPFGDNTLGIVDETQGGIIAYVHRDNTKAVLAALHRADTPVEASPITDAPSWVDRSDPSWPRGVTQDHLDADANHAAVGEFDKEGISDNCQVCGLATTSNGKRHGWDET